MAPCCTYYLQTIIPQLFNKSHTKNKQTNKLTLNEKCLKIFWRKKSGEWTISRKNNKTKIARGPGRKTNKNNQRTKRGDRKRESNDSPEIPDRSKARDITGLPSGFREREAPIKGKKRHLNHYGTILYRPERTYRIFTCVLPSSVRVGPVGPVTRSECCACLKNNPPLNYTDGKMGQHGRDRNSVLRLECRAPVLLWNCARKCGRYRLCCSYWTTARAEH